MSRLNYEFGFKVNFQSPGTIFTFCVTLVLQFQKKLINNSG